MSAIDTLKAIVKKCDEIDKKLVDDARGAVNAECTTDVLATKSLGEVLPKVHERVQGIRTAALSALHALTMQDEALRKHPKGQEMARMTATKPSALDEDGTALQQERAGFYREQMATSVSAAQKKLHPSISRSNGAAPTPAPATPDNPWYTWSGITQRLGKLTGSTPPPAVKATPRETIAHPEIGSIANTLAELDARVSMVRIDAQSLVRQAEAQAHFKRAIGGQKPREEH